MCDDIAIPLGCAIIILSMGFVAMGLWLCDHISDKKFVKAGYTQTVMPGTRGRTWILPEKGDCDE